MDSFNSITNTIYNNKIIALVILVVVAGALIYLLMSSRSESFVTGYPLQYYGGVYPTEGFYAQTGVHDENEQVKMILFYTPWCPHCKSLTEGEPSVWGTLKQSHKNAKIEQVNVDENADLSTQYGVKSIPTIKLIKGKDVKTYKGDRSLKSIEDFLTSDGQTNCA